jgi:hypothetical protein
VGVRSTVSFPPDNLRSAGTDVGVSVLVTVGGTGVAVGGTGVGLEGKVEGTGSVAVGAGIVSFLPTIVQATRGNTSRIISLFFICTKLLCMSQVTLRTAVFFTLLIHPGDQSIFSENLFYLCHMFLNMAHFVAHP